MENKKAASKPTPADAPSTPFEPDDAPGLDEYKLGGPFLPLAGQPQKSAIPDGSLIDYKALIDSGKSPADIAMDDARAQKELEDALKIANKGNVQPFPQPNTILEAGDVAKILRTNSEGLIADFTNMMIAMNTQIIRQQNLFKDCTHAVNRSL